MGWFWADSAAASVSRPPPSHARTNAEPPPGCPMHQTAKPSTPSSSNATASACPYPLPAASDAPPQSTANASPTPSYISKLNPLNYMPSNISNRRESSTQAVALPLDREASSIPRGDGAGNWEYPSPQQMYNAMLRKGYTDTPAEHVESMVAVHNFLNEGAWEEIKAWEARFGHGLARGWERCRRGEERATQELALEAFRREHSSSSLSSSSSSSSRAGDPGAATEPKLLRFMGRPSEPTPKARMLSFMAWLYPSQFPDNPPFDRHDWFVQRQGPAGATKEVRYVIDYYSGPPEPTGEPVFYLDVRPAVDGPTAACERLMRWGGDVWYRASGASVREELQRQKGR